MPDDPIRTVSRITRDLKDLIETSFPAVWVQGEVSNCTHARSGHIYLTLKDESAQLRAVIWRSAAARLKFDLVDGLEVVAEGAVEVYQPRGTYQLIVRQLTPQGVGALELAFRQLQQKLAAEGLFNNEHKRRLPRFPRRIALVTSSSGAAVRDMVQVICRRWRAADILVLPVAVQGEGAAREIAAALRLASRLPEIDVVITGRGGGSLEDLWAFNEEIVARAIFECPLPIISAVGHEIDVSIADLVADCRALTPSEAGELVVPQRAEVLNELARLQDRLIAALRDRAVRSKMQLDALASRRVFTRPLQRLHDLATRLDEFEARIRRAAGRRLEVTQQRLSGLSGALEALSPLRVLQRGYSITRRMNPDQIIRNVDQLDVGNQIVTHLHAGRLTSRIESIEPTEVPLAAANDHGLDGAEAPQI